MLKRTTKKLSVFVLLTVCLLCCLLLTSCGCDHQWKDADCYTPKTCTKCSKTVGEALGHDWAEANCQTPKTCKICQGTDGEDLGRHDYMDATTDAPKTCKLCGKTTGTKLFIDSRFSTKKCQALFGTWTGKLYLDGNQINHPGFTGKLILEYTITFKNNGNYEESFAIVEEQAFLQKLEAYYIDMLYEEYANRGMSKTQAEEAILQSYGVSITEYAKALTDAVDWENLFAANKSSGIYYAGTSTLYTGKSWQAAVSQIKQRPYTVSDFTLKIDSFSSLCPSITLLKSSED